MKQSTTHDLAEALTIIAKKPLTDPDSLINAVVCMEAAQRINQLVTLTRELTEHIVANPVHHPKCNAKTKSSYCSCILARLTPT